VTGPLKELPASAIVWLAVLSAVLIASIGFTTLMLAEAGVIDNVGQSAGAVIIMGRLRLAVPLAPLFVAIFAARLSVAVPGAALALPVSVNVQEIAPDEFTLGALQVAVNPFGSPETKVMVDPEAPGGRTTPPAGFAVTMMVELASDCMDTEAGKAASVTPGSC